MAGGRKKSIGKKEAILEAASAQFLEKGYSATSTNDICKSANINRPTLYYFCKNKRHLFYLCHLKSINSNLQPYLEKAGSIEDPLERLRFMVQEFTKMICRNPVLKVLIHETMSIKDEYFDKIRMQWKKHYRLLCSTISELQEGGILRTNLTPSWAVLFLLGMMTWITFWFDYEKTDSIEDIADEAFAFALKGLDVDDLTFSSILPRSRGEKVKALSEVE